MRHRVSHFVRFALLIACLAAGNHAVAAQSPLDQLIRLQREYHAQLHSGRVAEAEKTAEAMVALARKHFPGNQGGLAIVLRNLGEVRAARGRFGEAEPVLLQALQMQDRVKGRWHTDLALTLDTLGDVYQEQGKFEEALKVFQRSLAIRERAYGKDSDELGLSLAGLAGIYRRLGKLDEARRLYERVVEIGERRQKPGGTDLGADYSNLATVYHEQAQYDEAERLFRKALSIYKQGEGDQRLDIASVLNNLGAVYSDQGRYEEAEKTKLQVLEARTQALGPEHPDVAASLNNLARLYQIEGRHAEALALLRRALAIDEAFYGPEGFPVCTVLSSLSHVLVAYGRYGEAEPLQRKALSMRRARLGPEHPDVARSLAALGDMLMAQHRMAEAEPLLRRALAIREKALGPEHPQVSESLADLADVLYSTDRRDEAASLYHRAYEIDRRRLGENHPTIAVRLADLGDLHKIAGEREKAEAMYRRALAISQRAAGGDKPATARLLERIATLLLFHAPERLDEAEDLYDRAIDLLSQSQAMPHLRYTCYCRRGYLKWKTGDAPGAVGDARRAMEIAESQRGEAAGGEQETARYFSGYREAFEDMVRYQIELGNVAQAHAAAERGRARSLLDQMALVGADLLAGVDDDTAQRLRTQEAVAKRRVAEIAKRIERITSAKTLSVAERKAKLDPLHNQLAQARRDVVAAYRAIRNASPAYKLSVGRNFEPVTLDRLRRWVAQQDAVYLQYMVHETEPSYVLVISPGAKPRAVELNFDEGQAKEVGVEAGPAYARKLDAAMQVDDRRLIQLLSHPDTAAGAAPRLALLWELLVPEPERKLLTSEQAKRLIVVPDGPLVRLPFDALVIESGEPPTYLLDVGPPIEYGASATLLMNLVQKDAATEPGDRAPVLTVGDPSYEVGNRDAPERGALAAISARSRYRNLEGSLVRLPFSGLEARWVASVFSKNGIDADLLLRAAATEGQVRARAPGRRIIHFACHGLTSQAYGNLFGALALASGPAADPDNDGLLTLAEIYSMPLDGCELAILSACNTNFGPRQRGEAAWALSRGFLVAGSRRVVASNWVVDDKAGASLISFFCGGVAQQQGRGSVVDYATALHNAKRWVRNNREWKSPYYWGTFVLVGPG